MLIELNNLIEKFNIKINGVVYIGANRGQYINDYLNYTNKLVCFEPIKSSFEFLKNYQSDKVKIFNCALGDVDKKGTMFVSSNEGNSSSLLRPKQHLNDYPNVRFIYTEGVDVKKLSNFSNDIEGCNYIDMDVQGFEYQILVGAQDVLQQIDYIYMEVNRDETYENNRLVEDIDEFLEKFDFTRVETCWAARTWGDALYVRKTKL